MSFSHTAHIVFILYFVTHKTDPASFGYFMILCTNNNLLYYV